MRSSELLRQSEGLGWGSRGTGTRSLTNLSVSEYAKKKVCLIRLKSINYRMGELGEK